MEIWKQGCNPENERRQERVMLTEARLTIILDIMNGTNLSVGYFIDNLFLCFLMDIMRLHGLYDGYDTSLTVDPVLQ